MKNVFTKFLLLAAVVGVFAGCNKDEENDPTNYIQIGGEKTEIGLAAIDFKTVGSVEVAHFQFAGHGITIAPSGAGVLGEGDLSIIVTPNTPGTHTIAGAMPMAQYAKNLYIGASSSGDTGYDAMGVVVDGSTITWSKNGKIYTVDVEGNSTLEDGTPGEYFKLHYTGELLEDLDE